MLEVSQVNFTSFSEWWRAEQDVKQQRERQKNGGRRVDTPKEWEYMENGGILHFVLRQLAA